MTTTMPDPLRRKLLRQAGEAFMGAKPHVGKYPAKGTYYYTWPLTRRFDLGRLEALRNWIQESGVGAVVRLNGSGTKVSVMVGPTTNA